MRLAYYVTIALRIAIMKGMMWHSIMLKLADAVIVAVSVAYAIIAVLI